MERRKIRLPNKDSSGDFFAEYTVTEDDEKIVLNEGWINAPRRGNEIMKVIRSFLEKLAKTKNKKVIHQYEASTLKGKKLIQRQEGYQYKGRSSDGYSVYESEIDPDWIDCLLLNWCLIYSNWR